MFIPHKGLQKVFLVTQSALKRGIFSLPASQKWLAWVSLLCTHRTKNIYTVKLLCRLSYYAADTVRVGVTVLNPLGTWVCLTTLQEGLAVTWVSYITYPTIIPCTGELFVFFSTGEIAVSFLPVGECVCLDR